MEHALRCNSLTCRTQLQDRAVVTTCSHIFCLHCSDSLNLSNPNGNTRVCPACDTQLPNPDDAVVAQLSPSEDYKTSVLSGLNPTLILECAGRALNFYAYQTDQEISYQEFKVKSLTTKCHALAVQMDKVIDNANSEIGEMRNRLEAMEQEYKKLAEKNEKLGEAYRDKAKKQLQLTKVYNALKQKQLAAGLEIAADYDADHALHNVTTAPPHHNSNHANGHPLQSRAGSNKSGGKDDRRNNGPGWGPYVPDMRPGLPGSRNTPLPMTPSGHRQRLPQPLHGHDNMVNSTFRGDSQYQATPHRVALQNLDPNVFGNSNSPRLGGMSAGVKVGRRQGSPYQYGAIGTGRPGGLNLRG